MNINGFYKKVELLANIAIIILAISVGEVVLKNYFSPNNRQRVSDTDDTTLIHGRKFSLPEVDWKKNRRTLVLAISSTCHYCSESTPFYQRLSKELGDTRLVVVMPQPVEEGQKYISKAGIAVEDVRQAQFTEIGVKGTPTLILVDDAGNIIKSWIGKLAESQEADVLNQLRMQAPPAGS